jgi:hypothetical protein
MTDQQSAIGATTNNQTSSSSEVIKAQLKTERPNDEYTVTPMTWGFSDVQGGVSRLHAHHYRVEHWLIDAEKNTIRPPETLQKVFTEHGFVDGSSAHPAEDWAHLALCATRLRRSLVDGPSARLWASRLKTKESLAPAQLEAGKHGPMLTFWTYSKYRGIPTLHRHVVSVDKGGALVEDVSEGTALERQ